MWRRPSIATWRPLPLFASARLENGLLHVDLMREIPEAMKPRAIPIASSGKVLEVQPTKAAA
jgi:molecular chaperone IbpA